MKRFSALKLVTITLLFLGIVLFLPINTALAQVSASGTFTAASTCEAPRAINGANPGNVRVSKGQRYEVVSFNSQERRFILIRVPGANPERRWVKATCGNFSEVSTPSTPNGLPISSTELLPFFDNINNPDKSGKDMTPPPPQLSQFDRDVLQTCQAIGTKLRENNFKQLISNHPEVWREIKQAVGGQLLTVRSTDAEFLDDLTAVWSRNEGFEHIFCGELEGAEKIGGLHYFGRYLQLQNDKIGGRLGNNSSKEEVVPGVVYTLGVVVKKGNQIWRDDLKGYPLVTDAKELLLAATKAFKAQGNIQGACILPVQDRDSGKSYKAVFVKSRDAIVTFYPDATPSGKACRN